MFALENLAESIGVIMCTTGLFAAIMVCFAVPPKITKKLIGYFAGITAFGALLFYGYGYAYNAECSFWVSVLRATFAVCRIFVGANAWDDVKAAYMDEPVLQVLFWLLHLMGLFASASAVITALGSSILRKARLWALRRHNVSIIFGLNENTLDFGKELMECSSAPVLYVEQSPDNLLSMTVEHLGGILRTDADANNGSVRFLKSIGLKPGNRKIAVYALSTDLAANQMYAKRLLDSMNRCGITPQQTSLTLLGPVDETENRFLDQPGQDGYGTVTSINEPEMVARMLVREYPPCDFVDFDKNGKALNDFHGLVIGFGQVGQAVLKQLVMNGQFHGSNFRLAVFAPNYEDMMGCLSYECSRMLKHYGIEFYSHDGRSCKMFEYIDQNIDTLDYIAVCAGKSAVNMEIAEQLQTFLKHRKGKASVYICSHRGVFHRVSEDKLIEHKIYTPEILCSNQIDRMAMVLNHSYKGEGNMEENWRDCSYFNRMSSRASADFYRAILRAAGVTEAEAKVNWKPEGDLLENLAITEHLRWNAFHYCMGFRPMTDEEFECRKKNYAEDKAEDPDYRITRDMDKRIHACIIPWDQLDAYSRKENKITGESRDYAENDRRNVRSIGDVLRAMKE